MVVQCKCNGLELDVVREDPSAIKHNENAGEQILLEVVGNGLGGSRNSSGSGLWLHCYIAICSILLYGYMIVP